jgi:large subunit ribosomal protein L3
MQINFKGYLLAIKKDAMKALITKKIGMTNIIADGGDILPVTLLLANPCTITQIKTSDNDGYNAVQLGFGKAKNIGKSLAGHVKKSDSKPKLLKEFKDITTDEDTKVGTQITLETFEVGDIIDATAISKGKGFAGTIKRHNFHRGRKTHGGRSYRRPGSIGSMYPQKIFKGKKMAGHMGVQKTTVKNLKIALLDKDNQVIGVTGAVPGPRKGIVVIKGAK